ncbi:hypothetical protein D6D13_02360 [Aureobasidium pullulans]|uniref:Uncharacterized protein n=1 Tax=Aureobasidium pullulans TaxID=5580 RepID=A0A4S9D4T8_AURPU|nr:hypothetical protein D6D13_02360 [Aureobasidium pullulans]
MGAVLCAETFYSLCEEDRVKLRELSLFCPFTLAYKSCVHGNRCQRCKWKSRDKNNKQPCPSNHDIKARLFMGAMREPHRLGFYGVKTTTSVTGKPKASVERSSTGGAMIDPVDMPVARWVEHPGADLEEPEAFFECSSTGGAAIDPVDDPVATQTEQQGADLDNHDATSRIASKLSKSDSIKLG